MKSPPGTATGSGPLDIGRLGSRYHAMRAITSAMVLAASLITAFSWDWLPGLAFAAASAIAGAHALRRRRSAGPMLNTLLLDITLLTVALAVGAPPTEVAVAPAVVMVTTAALFLGDRKALWVGGYAMVGATAAFTWARLFNDIQWSPAETLILVPLSIACFVPLMVWLLKETTAALQERRVLEQTLRERESHYRLIAEGVSDAIVTTDESGVIMFANAAAERIFGYSADELVGKHLVILMPDRIRQSLRRGPQGYVELIRRSLDLGELEVTGRHRDGTELTLEVSFAQVVGSDGERFIGAVRDITDRKRAEAALRESEARYRGLFEGVPVGVYRTSISGEILDANRILVELLGLKSAGELIGRSAEDFYVDRSAREVWRHSVENVETAGWQEIQLRPIGGAPIWVRDSGRELRDADGTLVGYEGTLEDVTERRIAEERLQAMVETQRHRLLYEKALSACSHALLVGADDRALEEALEALLEATGVSSVFVERNDQDPEHGLVTSLLCELNADRQPPDYEHWQRVPWTKMPVAYSYLSKNTSYAFAIGDLEGEEKEIYEKTNTKAELDIPIFVGDEWIGLIGFTDYERERPWREEEMTLLRTAAQMIGAFWERQEAHRSLQQLVNYKSEFVASVSHELRTPLTAVVGLSEELANNAHEFSADELGEFHRLIAGQAREVAYIVEDLLIAARVENRSLTIEVQPVDLDDEVMATITGWPSEFGSVTHDLGGAKAHADPARVRQIARNLLTNAIRYGGDEVVVITHDNGGNGILQVRDNGEGLVPEDLERIFRPYERASGHVEAIRPGSVGLGLYVSRQLATLMGGMLTCRREDGWTLFELTLPLP